MKVLVRALFLILILWITMTVFGMRINVSQKLIQKGESYPASVSKDYGLVNDGDASLVCGYFTGLAVVHTVFWYSSNNILGKDSCPIWTDNK